jgi:hypothetical protein
MKKILLLLSFSCFFLLSAFALDVKNAPIVKESSSSSLSLEWEKVS